MIVLTAVEGILVFCARMIGDFNTTPSVMSILEEIDIGALVESVMTRLDFCGRVEIVNITKASQTMH